MTESAGSPSLCRQESRDTVLTLGAARISQGCCRAGDRGSVYGTPGKAGRKKGRQLPRCPCWALGSNTSMSQHSTLAPVQAGGTGPLVTGTRSPKAAQPPPPGLVPYVRQQMEPVPSRLARGWHRRRLQIPRLLTALVILSTEEVRGARRQGAGTDGLP